MELSGLVNIDYTNRMTIIAMIKEKNTWRAVALATYDLDRERNTAEVAFIVQDKFQNKGIGMTMMEQLIRIGREKAIKAFTAETLSQNVRMLELFYRTGLKVETRLVEDTYLVNMDLWAK